MHPEGSPRGHEDVPEPPRSRVREGLRLSRRLPHFRGPGRTRRDPAEDEKTGISGWLMLAGMLAVWAWIAHGIVGAIFRYRDGWRGWVLTLASVYVALWLIEDIQKLRKARRAKAGLGPPPKWRERWAYVFPAAAVVLVVVLGGVPSIRVPRQLRAPREWPAEASRGYRLRVTTWWTGGETVRYRLTAACETARCAPADSAVVQLRARPVGGWDRCALTGAAPALRCEGKMEMRSREYWKAKWVSIYIPSPPAAQADTAPGG
jgi:hypothetical protein